ncbi:YitT family protein [Paenibacillus chitinolyticus]|uniref:YitT family protein n=1 Tax=Paenibacillus chitinolyticus TaxID=79263 RepID=UPI003CFBE6DF
MKLLQNVRMSPAGEVPGGWSLAQWCFKLLMVICGSVLAAVGLELFLIPNRMLVGGMTGLSALAAHFTEMRLGLFLFVLNLPLILLSYRKIRRNFAVLTVLGLLVFSLSALILHPVPALIENPMMAAFCGGAALGLGIGLVIRYGATLDTLETRDHTEKLVKFGFKDQDFMLLNCFILAGAGFIYGWDQAMYSILAYLLAYETVHFSLRGFSVHRRITIVSGHCAEIEKEMEARLGRKVSDCETEEAEKREAAAKRAMPEERHVYGLERAAERFFSRRSRRVIANFRPIEPRESAGGGATGSGPEPDDGTGAPDEARSVSFSRSRDCSLSYTIHFMEEARLKAIVKAIDPAAGIVTDSRGRRRDGSLAE